MLAAGAVASGLGYLISIWPAPEPFVVPHDRDEVAVLPMTNVYGIDDTEQCLALLDDWVRRPNWVLALEAGVSGCVGDDVRDSLTVDADGDAVWIRNGLPARPLHLSPKQLASLHAAATMSCARPADDLGGYSSWYVEVGWGGPESLARRVYESPAQQQIADFISDAVWQYRDRRLAEHADFRASVRVEPYTVFAIDRPMTITLDGRGALTIRLRGHSVKAENLDVEALVDAIDWIEAGGPAAAPRMPPGLLYAIDRATFDAGLQH